MKTWLSCIGTITLGGGLVLACSSSSVLAGTDSNLDGQIDAGTGLCGSAACKTGELCCAGPTEACAPTCMAASTCPVYGRPCLSDAGPPAVDSGPPTQALTWYTTCGDPVCQISDAGAVDAGACPKEGTPCTTKDQTCGDPNAPNACGVILVCSNVDPKASGMCPRSSRKFKDDIRYADDAKLEALHDETLKIKLATYQYKSQFEDPKPTHLGFIIEDQPQSQAVEHGRDRVDMYGYLSMVVASMQVQEKEISELRRELEDAKRHTASCKTR